ncbi:2-hydroxyacid dehydrogenase [Jeotgalibacillus haloalkalitolerans]|uniref:D-glycerate dehydrogenase n=1 Tax=Jeotgalibacillus haloalkalitolerans TaxID=3104292 RepID=A0ABU5KQV2_9BACL|nr:D-glycerate dehydrogenase [Jeotgalibacillus sp. HH7-29]MDZ5713614.1 D-glycerate dehydrogenase [Jeotgalibacillus sp. HH7-29]
MSKIFITRKIDDAVIDELKKSFDVEVWDSEDEAVPRDVLLKQAKESHALLTMLSDQIDEELLSDAPHLKVVANMAVGYDNIDVEAAEKAGVIVTNTPDVLTDTTADLAFSLILATARRIPEAADYIKQGEWTSWSPYLLAGRDVHHKTLGIVGMGKIGQAVAKRAAGFDMNILYHTRSRKTEAEEQFGAQYKNLSDLLEKADFVLVLAPLTEETRGMIGAEQFKKMKDSAIFINVGRGPVVDEKSLVDALRNGDIAGAGLDVFEKEPISKEHPLLSMENVVAVPHIGSATTETRYIMMKLAADNIKAVLNGEKPLTRVTR